MNRHPARTRWRRVARIAAATLVAGWVFGVASPASAHVTVTPSTTTAGAHAILTFEVGHGCGKSPTTAITVRIPDQITSVTPTRTALWEVEKETEKVDPPAVDPHGNQIVERVASVSYRTDTPLPDGYREVFELVVQLPEADGTRLVFPTIQTCEQGESAWIEVAQDGGSVEDLELPAPSFVISGSVSPEGAHHHAAVAAPASASGGTLAISALVAGILGSLLGGAALVRQRRRT
ncbi:hypothetical protein Ais01nite_21250 [Asanoa ishikariensis]|uniref:Uncharacterized protein YcnI n=1 Tax=Asanoa ishikariensis TaxID=137265 RepID=A0A1H3U8H5_9ACTN|nr:YcnI family protein [Asanoa ishikariensis]GIF64090.1 hypothetical protein Ais01nite_21250 [Asanoa ishikariensis]SDZ58678.1 Uncharacterized protein YcnI [Asanoa ishikariensis]